MIADFSGWIVEGFLAPRRSARRILERTDGLVPALWMLMLGYLITAIFVVLLDGPRQEGPWLAERVVGAVMAIGFFFFMSGLIFVLGRMSGGEGTHGQTYVIVGWHGLVTSFLTPPMLWAMSAMPIALDPDGQLTSPAEIPGSALLAMLVAIGLWFWLLASYVAELHRFASTWGVLGVLVGVPFGALMLLTMMLGAAALPQ